MSVVPGHAFAQLEGHRQPVGRTFPACREPRGEAVLAFEGGFGQRLYHFACDEENAVRRDDCRVEILRLGIGRHDQPAASRRILRDGPYRHGRGCEKQRRTLKQRAAGERNLGHGQLRKQRRGGSNGRRSPDRLRMNFPTECQLSARDGILHGVRRKKFSRGHSTGRSMRCPSFARPRRKCTQPGRENPFGADQIAPFWTCHLIRHVEPGLEIGHERARP